MPVFAVPLIVAGCAAAPPAQPASAPAEVGSAAPAAAASGAPDAAAEPEVEAEPKRPLPPVHIENLCHDVAMLAYGEPPNMHPDAIARFAGDGAEGSAARDRDGTLAVTLVDAQGNALAKVHVSRRMKKVEIGRSCRTLFAK